MSVDQEVGAALEPVAPPAPIVRAADAMMSDDEIRRAYRIAEALFQSRAFKDVKSAEAAFAKMVIGRDLGLSPAQAMGGIHLVEGGVQMHYAMLGQFVRARSGYDYRPAWIKRDHDHELADLIERAGRPPTEREQERLNEGILVVVWHDEEDPDDFREIVGALIDFTVNGERRGISRFTIDDARTARLIKDDPRAAWNTSPRNMLLARSMSNGVKWYVPEVLGGLPVYVEGELDHADRPSLTAPTQDADDAGQGVDLGPAVEKIIARAEALGHRGLSNRGSLELALGGRSPSTVKDWVERAKAELDRFAAEKAKAEKPASSEDQAPAGEAQADADAPSEAPAEQPVTPEETVTGEVVAEPEAER